MKLHDEITRIPVESITPNPWNPNKQSDFIFEKEKNSIKQFGFIDPILVRKDGKKNFQIIDGEHRYRAAKDLGIEYLPAIVINVTDEKAKQLTIIMNETRGDADPGLLSKLIKDINKEVDLDSMLSILPYSQKEIENLITISDLSWDDVSSSLEATPKEPLKTPETPSNGIVQVRQGSNVKTILLHLPEDLYDRFHAIFYELGCNIEKEEPAWETLNDMITPLEEWVKSRDQQG